MQTVYSTGKGGVSRPGDISESSDNYRVAMKRLPILLLYLISGLSRNPI